MKNFLTFLLIIIILFGMALLYRPASDTSGFGIFIENMRMRLHIPIPTVDEVVTDTATPTAAEETPTPDLPAEEESETVTTTTPGYVEFSDGAFREAMTQGKQAVLFFHADRCPTCRELEKNITSESNPLPNNVVVFKVDYDTANDLKIRYRITSQSTLVYVDENMEEVNRQQGITTVEDLLEGFTN